MKYAAVLDLETTGLSAETDRPIEVCVSMFDLVAATPIYTFASLIQSEENGAELINRIPVGALQGAPSAEAVWQRVGNMLNRADCVIAHRKVFDMSFTPAAVRDRKPWVCSKFELEFPRGKVGDSLVTLALAHDLGVAYAHRASADVDLLCRIFARAKELGADPVAIIERGLRPRALFEVAVENVSDELKELAKSHGFGWVKCPGWKLRGRILLDDVAGLPFPVVRVDQEDAA